MNLLILSLFTIILIAQHPDVAAAAKLVFHTNEPVIHMVLTKQLQLRCSVSATASMASNPSTAVSEDSDIAHVISIVITKNSNRTGQIEPVASISQFEPASLDGSEFQNAHVEGNTTENAGNKELGYLQVTWNGPTGAEAGNYTCEITALTSNKHVIELKGNLNITASEPGVSDLVRFIIEHDRLINQLQVTNEDLVNKTEEMRANLTASNQLLQHKIIDDIESLRSNMSNYGSELSWIKARINSTLLESGLTACNNNTNVVFRRHYTQVPRVLVSISNAMFDSNSPLDFGFEVYVISVSLNGFSAYSAHLTFESTPGVIYPIVTKQLRLRCSVLSTGIATATTVTTPIPVNTTNPGILVVHNLQLQSTSDSGDVNHVMSIIIAKTDNSTGQSVNVASVTAYDQAIAEGPFSGKVRVEGSSQTSPLTNELGYLELIWDGPAEDQAGNYTCEIYGLNPDKHSMYLRTSKEVFASEPDVATLINFIIQHDTIIEQLQTSNRGLKEEEARLEANLTANHELLLQAALKEAEQMRSNLNTGLGELDDIADLLGHSLIQTGQGECNNGTEIRFRHHYNSTPDVLVSITDAEFNPNLFYWPYYEDFGFQIYVQTVDQDGFSAFCKKKGSNSYANFTWLATDRRFW